MAQIPGPLETQTRTPLDGKYWINNYGEINNGLTFQGLIRFDKATDKLWIKLTSGWTEFNITGGNTVGEDQYNVPLNIRQYLVLSTSWNSSQELSNTNGLPTGSTAGMKFSYQGFQYEYMPGDNGSLIWIKNRKVGGGATTYAQVIGSNTKYPTYADAENAASIGNEILLSGYFPSVYINKSVNVRGGIVGDVVIGFSSPSQIISRVSDTLVLNKLTSCTSLTQHTTQSPRNYDITLENIRGLPLAYLEQFSLGVTTTNTNQVRVINTTLINSAPYVGMDSNGAIGNGVVRWQERPENSTSIWTFEDCYLRSVNTSVFTGYAAPNTKAVIRDFSTFLPAQNKPLTALTVLNSGVPTPESTFILDQRTTFKYISQNQVGTHPSFSNQNSLNLYLLQNIGTTPPPPETVTITNVTAA